MEYRFPVIQDATYTKHVYQHSKHYVGLGSCIRGDDIVEEKSRICGFLIVVVLNK